MPNYESESESGQHKQQDDDEQNELNMMEHYQQNEVGYEQLETMRKTEHEDLSETTSEVKSSNSHPASLICDESEEDEEPDCEKLSSRIDNEIDIDDIPEEPEDPIYKNPQGRVEYIRNTEGPNYWLLTIFKGGKRHRKKIHRDTHWIQVKYAAMLMGLDQPLFKNPKSVFEEPDQVEWNASYNTLEQVKSDPTTIINPSPQPPSRLSFKQQRWIVEFSENIVKDHVLKRNRKRKSYAVKHHIHYIQSFAVSHNVPKEQLSLLSNKLLTVGLPVGMKRPRTTVGKVVEQIIDKKQKLCLHYIDKNNNPAINYYDPKKTPKRKVIALGKCMGIPLDTEGNNMMDS
jgi:hypothetical protein